MNLFDELDASAVISSPTAGSLNLAERLNPSQLAAATYANGPLLIVAGAGSGKTRTLVHRVAHLVDSGVAPRSILLLTFTRKAAQEMLGRATALVGKRAAEVAGGTFHSLANYLIRPYAPLLSYPSGFSIMDQDDAESLIARIRSDFPEVKKHKRFPQKGAILGLLSQAINKDRPLLEVIADSSPHFLEYAPLIEKIGLLYREHKIQNALMDFDDLLLGLESILRDHEDLRFKIASRYQYILVDEYQDTNPIQARLTHLLGRDHLNVTAVGDDAQSIYAFRGASFRNIMDFPKIFPGTQILKLEENYRSQKPIVALANGLIAQAREKYDKKLVAVRDGGENPKMVAVQDRADEAGWVAAAIEKYLEEGLSLSDMAVLFRASSHSFDLEVELVRRKIPYTKYGGRKFLESAHIKDFLAFLKIAANPADTVSLRRVLTLLEGVGLKGAEKIIEWIGRDREKLCDLKSVPLSPKIKKNMEPMALMMEELAREDTELNRRVKLVADFYYPQVREIYTDDWPDRQSDIRDIIRMAEEREDIRAFLDDLTLDPPNQKRSDPEEKTHGLTLSTVHSAKGLEWKVVFILSAVEGCFPPSYAARSAEEVEEERRLMYVAVTRAEDMLYIMLPLGTIDRRTGMMAMPSRFLAALSGGNDSELYRNDSELCANDVLIKELDLEYNRKVQNISNPFASKAVKDNTSKLANNPALTPKAATAAQLVVGARLSHPIYGAGRLVSSGGSAAIIDFDHFGEKRVVLQYARLSLL